MEFFLIIVLLCFVFHQRAKKRPFKVPVPQNESFDNIPFESPLPYRFKYILTNNEYSFYIALKPLMDSHSFLICPKVGLKDMFEPLGYGRDRMSNWGRISQKHIDFLICDNSLRPVFAIELDDRSHSLPETKKSDAFKDALFRQAHIPLYRVPAAMSYNQEYILPYIQILQPNEKQNPQFESHL